MMAIPAKRRPSFGSAHEKDAKKIQRHSPNSHGTSLISHEGAAFQRGGASIITPLERKQLHAKANQDAFIEDQTGLQSSRVLGSDGDLIEEDSMEDLLPPRTAKKPKRRSFASQAPHPNLPSRVDSLSYKRVTPGLAVLGCIMKVNRHDVTLALPNNLVGYVPANRISEALTRKLKALDDASNSEDEGSQGDSGTVNLADYVRIGQYLRAKVISCTNPTAPANGSKKHIELSVLPREVNNDLTVGDLAVNCTIQAEVLSIEDHGLLLDTGLKGGSTKAFMSSRELNAAFIPNPDSIRPGAVILSTVSNISSNGKVVKLSANEDRFKDMANVPYLTAVSTIDALLPGTAIEFLVSSTTASGLRGKMMDLVDVTSDLFHSGLMMKGASISQDFPVGMKLKARIIYTANENKVSVSVLDHVMRFSQPQLAGLNNGALPTDLIAVSTIINELRVERIEPEVGLLMDVGIHGIHGFAHISRIADERIRNLDRDAGPYHINSSHKGRVVAYNPMDGLFLLSLEQKILDLPFLSLEDIQPGQIAKAVVEKIILDGNGVRGIVVNVTDSISGFIPQMHLSDVTLQYPERKFKKGITLTVRVLSNDLETRRLRLTCKKSLVNSKYTIITSFHKLKPGVRSLGTIISLFPSGALVEFYGHLKGFLPISEMSEAFIRDPKDHFRIGQVVDLKVKSLDPLKERITVSCRRDSDENETPEDHLNNLSIGAVVEGTVIEKLDGDFVLDLQEASIKAILPFGHLLDDSIQKTANAAKRIRVGQLLQDLVVLGINRVQKQARLTRKPSLIEALESGKLLKSFSEIIPGSQVLGFVRNITPSGVFVQFAGELIGLLPRGQLSEDMKNLSDFGMQKYQVVSCHILSVDYEEQRFFLTQRNQDEVHTLTPASQYSRTRALTFNSIDGSPKCLDELALGKLTQGRILGVKASQLNVQLGDGVFGRVHVSEIFASWDDIKDRKRPLTSFRSGQIIGVRIIGIHDTRNHRFLPISHRRKTPVFELSAKPDDKGQAEYRHLTLDQINVGSSWLGFVNNLAGDFLWINLTPDIRGRIHVLDISEDLSITSDPVKHYPVGSAIRAQVVALDLEKNHLDLTAKPQGNSMPKCLEDLRIGTVLPGRVAKVTQSLVVIQLSDSLIAPLHIIDMADDYSRVNLSSFYKGQFLTVSICNLDATNKHAILSTRPSWLVSSSNAVTDPEITSISQLHVNGIVRGFVKNITDSGVFITLSRDLTGFVRVSDLSDKFIKDWQAAFQLQQLVKGRIIAIDTALQHIRMSLKESVIESNYVAPLAFDHLSIGQVLNGKVRNVQKFGVFVVFDDSENVSGLCHRTEIADTPIASAKELFNIGDAVRVKVLKIEKETRRVSLGMKTSYFIGPDSLPVVDNLMGHSETQESPNVHGVDIAAVHTEAQEALTNSPSYKNSIQRNEEVVESLTTDVEATGIDEVDVGGFDWTGSLIETSGLGSPSPRIADHQEKERRRKHTSAPINNDCTGDMDNREAQSASDFERLLLGRPNSSYLWLGYMAFHLQLNEVDSARQIAERALMTISSHSRDTEDEALNIWIGYLNLEDAYGDDESIENIFQRACQRNDPKEVFSRLASIYIQSEKHQKADQLLHTMCKKFSSDPKTWHNYATFLFEVLGSPSRGRELLAKALQSLPKPCHIDITSKFAQLEFKSSHGDNERGRTIFEGLFSSFPKRLDLWNVLLDLEVNAGAHSQVRGLFDRVTSSNIKAQKAKFFFKKWLEYEEKNGDMKSCEEVKARAADYVRKQAG